MSRMDRGPSFAIGRRSVKPPWTEQDLALRPGLTRRDGPGYSAINMSYPFDNILKRL